MRTIDEGLALGYRPRPSAFDQKSFSIDNRPNLRVKRLDLLLALAGGSRAASGKCLLQAIDGLLLPGLYLVRMHFKAGGEVRQRAVAALRGAVGCLGMRCLSGLVGLEQDRNPVP